MKKIVVLGSGGAGKSTFARKLEKILDIKAYHLDTFHWKPGWVATPNEEWEKIVRELVSNDEWIIDGNYGRTINMRINLADTIFFLDMPIILCLYRVIKRRIIYHKKSRPDMNSGCEEKLDWEFINWIINFKKNKKPEIVEKLNKYKDSKEIIIFNNSRQLNKYLNNLQKN